MNPSYVDKNFIIDKLVTKRYIRNNATSSREMIEYSKSQHEIHEKITRIPRFSLFFSPIIKWEKLNLVNSHVIIHRKKLTLGLMKLFLKYHLFCLFQSIGASTDL